MAENAVIGALRVVLGLDSATFEQGLKDTGKQLSAFEKSFGGISAGVVAGGALIANALSSLASSIASSMGDAIDKVSKIGLTAQKIGANVEDFAALAGAASKVKVSTDELGTSLARLSRSIAEVASGKQGDAQKAFEVLGISVRDASGQVKTSTQVFAELSDKFKNYTEGANEVALATALMGRSGADMIPVLNQGSAAVKKQAEEMAALGIVMDKDTVANAIKVQKEWDKLGKIFDNVILRITIGLLPQLQAITGALADAAKQSTSAQLTFDIIAGTIDYFGRILKTVGTIIEAAAIEVVAFYQAASQATKGEFSAAITTLGDAQTRVLDLGKAFLGLKITVGAAGSELIDYNALLKQVGENMNALSGVKIAAPAIPLGNLSKTLADLTIKTAETRGEFDKLAPGFAAQAAALGLIDQAAVRLTNDQTTLTASQQALNQAMLQNTGAQMAQQALDPWQQYEQQVGRVNVLLQNHAITAQQAAQISRKAAESTGQAWDIAAGNIAANIASGLAAAAQSNKEFSAAAKVAAIAQAVFNTYTAATKALATYPPPFGEIAAGAAIVAGLGMVAKIQAQQFAGGGGFKVGGGITGVDSQLVAFNATPGEMVDIRRPGQAGSSTSGGAPQEIALTGIKPGDLFSGDMLRGLFNSLNAGMKDGYRLTVPT